MFLETICFLLLFCTRFFIRIFIFFYLYTFILEMLGKLLKSLWNSHCVVNIAWHATPLTTWRTRRSKIWIFLFILFPIYLCPVSSLIKIKGQGLISLSHFSVCNLSGAERELWHAKYRNIQPSVSDEIVETGWQINVWKRFKSWIMELYLVVCCFDNLFSLVI